MTRKELIKKMYGKHFSECEYSNAGEPVFGWHLEDGGGELIPLSDIDNENLVLIYDADLEVDCEE